MNKILVTGASGWIGRQVCKALQQSGFDVIALQRNRDARTVARKTVYADLCQENFHQLAKVEAIAGCDGIVHCAGHAHRPIETTTEIKRFEAINHCGSQRVVDLAQAIQARRLIYLSSIAFYDWTQRGPINEQGQVAPTSAYARTKLAGERCFLESGLEGCSLRLATVFGDGDVANMARLAQAMKRRRFILPGKGNAGKSMLPIDLAADAVVRVLLAPVLPHRIYNVALRQTPTLGEITGAFRRVCGFPPTPQIPSVLLRIAARVGDVVDQGSGRFPLTTGVLAKLETSTAVDTSRLIADFPDWNNDDFGTWLGRYADYYRAV